MDRLQRSIPVRVPLALLAVAALWLSAPAAPARAAAVPEPDADAPVILAPPAVQDDRQVRVEVRILEWKLSNAVDVDFAVMFNGVEGSVLESADLTLPGTGRMSSAARLFLSGLDTGSGSFEAVIETLERAGEIEVLTQTDLILPVQPKTPGEEYAAFDGKITSESRIPFETVKAFGGVRLASTTEYKNTGVEFQCSALEILYDEFVRLAIKAGVSDLNDFISIGTNFDEEKKVNEPLLVPVTDDREMMNQVLVRDGSIIIAGLVKATREVKRRQGIPFLSELPILRWLLSSHSIETETSELVFLVRTEILETSLAAEPIRWKRPSTMVGPEGDV